MFTARRKRRPLRNTILYGAFGQSARFTKHDAYLTNGTSLKTNPNSDSDLNPNPSPNTNPFASGLRH